MIFLKRYKRYITQDKSFCRGLGVVINNIIYNLIHVSKYNNLQCIINLAQYKLGKNNDPSILIDNDYWPSCSFELIRKNNKYTNFINYIGSLNNYITLDIWYMKNGMLYSYNFDIHNSHLKDFEIFVFNKISQTFSPIAIDMTSLYD